MVGLCRACSAAVAVVDSWLADCARLPLHLPISLVSDGGGRKFHNDKKRCVTLQRAHNNMFTHVAHAWCSDACPPVATLVCLTALLMIMRAGRVRVHKEDGGDRI